MSDWMITTKRLIIRDFTEADTEALFLILSDREVNTYLPWFPLEMPEEAEQYLAEAELRKIRYGDCLYAVCRRTDPIPVGYLQLSGDDSHDFGYALRKEFWGQGSSPRPPPR